MLTPILNAIIQKMRYDETSSWGNEDEQTDEAEFQELRKRLQVLQKSVAAVDEALYLDVLSNVVGNTFQRLDEQGGQMDWRDLDLALHEMYLFGELTVPNGGLYAKSQPSSVAAERLIVMMSKMVESGKQRISDLTENFTLMPARYCFLCSPCYPTPVYGDMRSILLFLREPDELHSSSIRTLCTPCPSQSH